MSINQFDIIAEILSLQDSKTVITSRIKQLNSIEYKIERYQKGDLAGGMPINKCLNDLFGVRIIIDEIYDDKELREYLAERYPKLKVIDSSKDRYKATHLYFYNDNYSFPWELQIWKKVDESGNLLSHKKYKQGYTIWENRYKAKQ